MSKTEKICVFGIGERFAESYNQVFAVLGKAPDFFCDNDPTKWGESFWGVPCYPPQQLQVEQNPVKVIITARRYEDVALQLQALGIHDPFVMVYSRQYYAIDGVKPLGLVSQGQIDRLDLKGKWAFITGASRGIGYQVACALALQGMNIVVHSRSTEHNTKVVSFCHDIGVETVSLAGDLGDTQALLSLLETLEKEGPAIDVLYNCAGVSLKPEEDPWQMTAQTFQETFAVNTVAPILISNHLIPQMLKRGFGRIINVSSSIQNSLNEMAYACSKAALDKYAHDILPQLKGSDVRISSLDPGWLKTDMGGAEAPHEVENVLPGALLGAVMTDFTNGRWFTAQDYCGLEMEQAIQKAHFVSC
ncbi:SDR family oxidoreductase [Terasakiella sp. SH-1]|uniref:SDR family NAD(P)-dependent oxidoreductase n=1 Tax=Terasakiella sp. SH-1 TaxID=2560057 RepID=UPI00107440D8|nr:SDR family oxidoreductase [Terasakiella sp. SH-1]